MVLTNSRDSDETPGPVRRFNVRLPESRSGPQGADSAISPDDTKLAFRVGNDLYIRSIETLAAVRITDVVGIFGSFLGVYVANALGVHASPSRRSHAP